MYVSSLSCVHLVDHAVGHCIVIRNVSLANRKGLLMVAYLADWYVGHSTECTCAVLSVH